MLSDLRFALRQLLKSPGFTAVAVISLALGIGANTAIFSLVNDFLLRTLPVPHPEELVLFRVIDGVRGTMVRGSEGSGFNDPATGRYSRTSLSLQAFERMRDQASTRSPVFAYSPLRPINLLIDGELDVNAAAQVASGNYHAGLGVSALLGRTLGPDDDRASAAPVAVISHRYWQARFGGDPAVLGRTILVNKVAATIVGVTPRGFDGALQAGEVIDITLPMAHIGQLQPARAQLKAQPSYGWLRVMARLAPAGPEPGRRDASVAQVRASLEPVLQVAASEGFQKWRSDNPAIIVETPDVPSLALDPGARGENEFRRQKARPLWILLGLVGLVLLAACANVANLLLARGAARRREIAVRLALGASRRRIVGQLLAESLLLAALSAAIGTLLAWWAKDLLLALRPFGNTVVTLDLPLDGRVLGFTIIVALATAVCFGLVPALRLTRLDLNAEFQGGGRSLAAGARSRLSQGLMVAQIALSLVLLVSTGLFIRTLRNLQNIDPGFNHHRLALFRIDLNSAGYSRERFLPLFTELNERLARIPGVQVATYSDSALLSRGRSDRTVVVEGYTPPAGQSMNVSLNALAPNFFTAMEMPLVLGRGFTEHDHATAPKVAVVNQAFVQKYFGAENPVGRRLGWGGPSLPSEIEIVGVARDAKYEALRAATRPTVYLPVSQQPAGGTNFALRTQGDPARLFPAIRASVREIDPTLPVFNLRTQDEQLDWLHGEELLFARLSGFFGLLALALACVGLYGLMSYTVLRRTGEIGLRMALGALPAHVLRMILRESLLLVGLGVIAGVGLAVAGSRLVASMLFDLSPTDPITYTAVALLLIGVSLLAALLPARRASRVDPMTALRSE